MTGGKNARTRVEERRKTKRNSTVTMLQSGIIASLILLLLGGIYLAIPTIITEFKVYTSSTNMVRGIAASQTAEAQGIVPGNNGMPPADTDTSVCPAMADKLEEFAAQGKVIIGAQEMVHFPTGEGYQLTPTPMYDDSVLYPIGVSTAGISGPEMDELLNQGWTLFEATNAYTGEKESSLSIPTKCWNKEYLAPIQHIYTKPTAPPVTPESMIQDMPTASVP